ncbi:hypothetical protein [Promicromonospora soli]|uniref:Secreted protein n=1 Tax=Promicromonospora soli TaxID=2035533 RepID=A0A919G2M4_9MICO|nr:hypothetical protein [Promicromonospora soli]GHH76458.1 hypothetical protein GCM10017772_35170 [Promicromonospora soli]
MLKNRTIAQKLGSVMFAGLMVLTAGVTMAAAPASATSCSSHLDREDRPNALDGFRAGASCSDINGNHKVRAQLIRDGGTDNESSWFTTENKTYHTVWTTCYLGCDDDYEVGTR